MKKIGNALIGFVFVLSLFVIAYGVLFAISRATTPIIPSTNNVQEVLDELNKRGIESIKLDSVKEWRLMDIITFNHRQQFGTITIRRGNDTSTFILSDRDFNDPRLKQKLQERGFNQ